MKVSSYITKIDTGESIDFSKVKLDDIIQYELKIKTIICQKMKRQVVNILIHKDS